VLVMVEMMTASRPGRSNTCSGSSKYLDPASQTVRFEL
jgi:hypothetical protein